jgi:hypothetical protein
VAHTGVEIRGGARPGAAAVPWAQQRSCGRGGTVGRGQARNGGFSPVGLGPDGLGPVRHGAGLHSEGGRPV